MFFVMPVRWDPFAISLPLPRVWAIFTLHTVLNPPPMHLLFKRSAFLKKLFPTIDIHNDEQLIHALEKSYSIAQWKPEVTISGDTVEIHLPNKGLQDDPGKFKRAIDLCAQRNFAQARPILEELIRNNPTVSEYHRNLAQTYEEEGQHERAVDGLIEALKWDPTNHWALILMGNIHILDSGVGKNIAPLQNKGMLRAEVLKDKQLEKYLKADW